MSEPDAPVPPASPWGEPAPPPGSTGPVGTRAAPGPPRRPPPNAAPTPTPTPTPGGRRRPRPGESTRTAATSPPDAPPGRRPLTMRLVSATTRWARVRAAVVLILIGLTLGVAIAGALGLVVWGISTAIHHAANN